ncbi:MAG: acyltransferase, partial [Thalassotalea sp.]|nr:acyltransferase [Thalassotalea sp.]
ALVMKALYSFKGVATQVEISAKIKRKELATSMLDFLVEKGIVEEKSSADKNLAPCYRLTFLGKGCLLHLYPSLA